MGTSPDSDESLYLDDDDDDVVDDDDDVIDGDDVTGFGGENEQVAMLQNFVSSLTKTLR